MLRVTKDRDPIGCTSLLRSVDSAVLSGTCNGFPRPASGRDTTVRDRDEVAGKPVTTPRSTRRGGRPARYRAAGVLLLLAALVLGMSAVSGSGNVASAAPSASDWQRLRECESGNNYSINTGNGYYGAYQFDLSTWRSVGGTGYPHQASPATQDALALALWQQRGWSPWVCARILGLGNNPDPDPPVGAIDPVVHNGLTASVSGWAFDASNYGQSIQVHVNVNGNRNVFTADQPRPELAQYGIPGIHGFRVSVPLERGRNNEICVWAIGIAANNVTQVSCTTVGPASSPPVGAVDPDRAQRHDGERVGLGVRRRQLRAVDPGARQRQRGPERVHREPAPTGAGPVRDTGHSRIPGVGAVGPRPQQRDLRLGDRHRVEQRRVRSVVPPSVRPMPRRSAPSIPSCTTG